MTTTATETTAGADPRGDALLGHFPRAPHHPIADLLAENNPRVPCDNLVDALRDLARWEAIDIGRVATFIECEIAHDEITRRAAQDLAPALAIAWLHVQQEAELYRRKAESAEAQPAVDPERHRLGNDGEERSAPADSSKTYSAAAVADALNLCENLIEHGGGDVDQPNPTDLCVWLNSKGGDREAIYEVFMAIAPIVRRVWDRKQADKNENRSQRNRPADQVGAS
jgi:hypothetical protein